METDCFTDSSDTCDSCNDFEKQIGVSIEISACIGAIILVLVGVLSEKEALASIDLKVVFLLEDLLHLPKPWTQQVPVN